MRGTSTAQLGAMKSTTSVNALELLRSQHTEVEDLIAEIEDSDDPGEKCELFQRLADNLAAHAVIEEKIFYPSVMTEDTREQLIESTEEHLAVKRLLADMMELDCEDEHFDAKLTVLKENIRHHAHDEEEGSLFPIVEEMLDEDELAALGNELLAMFESLLERAPRKLVPSETRRAAELRV
jgi:hemerythrin superfamily protein